MGNENRGLKNRTAISNAVDTKLLNELKAYSRETDIPLSKLLDRAIRMFLATLKNHDQNN